MSDLKPPFDNNPYFFLVNKPVGVTSYDVLRKLKPVLFSHLGKGKGRRKLKVGHFGTLDPFASGLLIVGTGKALKLTQYVHDFLFKDYEAYGVLGVRTLTGDCDGDVVLSEDCDVSIEDIKKAIEGFPKDYEQKPSYFSAVKHLGKPLYEYARSGVYIEKPAVHRVIDHISFEESLAPQEIRFSCTVSTGTYIRVLWEDLCAQVNTVGHLKALKRVGIGPVKLEHAVDLDDVHSFQDLKVYRPEDILTFNKFELSPEQLEKVRHGAEVSFNTNEDYIWLNHKQELCALAKRIEDDLYRPCVNLLSS